MSTQAERNLSVSVREQRRLMRELSAANKDMQRIYESLKIGRQDADHARAIAKQWLEDRGLLSD